MNEEERSFGVRVRALRMGKGMSLRGLARTVGVSPTYLSHVERGLVPPPAEDKVTAIAAVLGDNVDTLMGLTGRVPCDLRAAILRYPEEMAQLIRATVALSRGEIVQLAETLAIHASGGVSGSAAGVSETSMPGAPVLPAQGCA